LEGARASDFDGRVNNTDDNGSNAAASALSSREPTDAGGATESAALKRLLYIIKETRPHCKRFFDFFSKNDGEIATSETRKEWRILRIKAIVAVKRETSEKIATNRELSGRGASKRIDAEILSVIII